jgi:hypothetical protein
MRCLNKTFQLQCSSPDVPLKGPSAYAYRCLLIGHDQTCRGRALTAEFDPGCVTTSDIDALQGELTLRLSRSLSEEKHHERPGQSIKNKDK